MTDRPAANGSAELRAELRARVDKFNQMLTTTSLDCTTKPLKLADINKARGEIRKLDAQLSLVWEQLTYIYEVDVRGVD